MNGDPHPQNPLPPLPCEQIVYRAQIKKDWVANSGKVRKQAFFRMHKDTHGLSVSTTEDSCGEGLQDEFYGTITLHVGRVRTLGLDVIPDSPTHANIQGVPMRDANDPVTDALARTLAEDLANMARRLPD